MAAKRQKILIDGYQIDASLSEEHTYDSDVTEYPVENGSAITDNVRPKPITVTIEGIVSDTPIGSIADVRHSEDGPDGTFLPSDEALTVLEAIRLTREPVSITTTLRTFDNMVMTSLSIPRDADTGFALRFSATFQEVIFVTNNRTTVRIATPTGASRNLGTQPGLGKTNLLVGGKPITKVGTKGPDHMPVYQDANGNPVSDADLNKAVKDAGAVRINPRTGQPLDPSEKVDPRATYQVHNALKGWWEP